MTSVSQAYQIFGSFKYDSQNLLNQSKKDSRASNEGNLSFYLNSEQSHIQQITQQSRINTENGNRFMTLQQKHYFACPELYQSFRNEHIIEDVIGDNFKILKFSKGRNQIFFRDCVQIELKQLAKLTVWNNGDYKLVYGDTVYFWCEQYEALERYSIAL